MIRTIWLAIALALVSALTVGKAVRTPAGLAAAEISPDASTVGVADAEHALSKADRLEINYVRQEASPQAVLQPIEPTTPVVIPPSPPVETKIISRHWRDPHAFSPSPKDSQRSEFRKTRKNVDRKRNQAMDRSKPSDPVKPCSRPGPVGDLLRAVNLSPACAS
ncbi:hypothetical protein [Bradyrhizobium sp. JYMT SZCCT0180]|uniref:hypothetical protein n=1 Tax=Bradyrhizobium sp. JYMT SZCCT0180 TaxID=2807666 RepID=UPI001BA700D4|nr:hypothetical protein [Bradyrhizobium sp. JYMT SZCCT0180]MBR1212795.1 hypothetical protein [Bradyrhizobium sp. JYMT SZCCT0180]